MAMIGKADAMLEFGDITLGSGTVSSANVVDLAKTDAERMRVVFNVTTAGAGGTSVVLKLQGSTDGETFTDIAATGSILLADLTVGKSVSLGIPEGYAKSKLRAQAVCTGTFTGGKIDAFIDTYMGA